MNRLFTLKETLPGNIAACKQYPNAEVVLLDYNSDDGLSQWVYDHFREYIAQELLVFYQLIDPQPRFFSHAHSRNMAFCLATGDILCNVNADYHIAAEDLCYMNDKMQPSDPLALIAHLDNSERDNLGRLCLRKEDFELIGGFDERFKSYGYEDIDLNMRLKMADVRIEYMPAQFDNAYVDHEDRSRLENSYDYHHLKRAFLRKMAPGRTRVLFLYDDQHIEAGTLIKSGHNFPDIEEEGWLRGQWLQAGKEIWLEGLGTSTLRYREGSSQLIREDEIYEEVTDISSFQEILFKKSIIQNYQLMKNRRRSENFRANADGFGKGVVIKNFSEKIQLG
ncbi:glycosyltransferase family 2 protein [Chitinophaga sancti]|uniref:Galactosyltransferase-related protein n=1 Tax=Chitinophaga sancti TaxID=1004 RepID=A0A1K1LUR2_9BACT|nr:galactosyltransferase-related protein [Chitinophaga sancti]WQD64907.1 galactosyltransferase-related protein [Chitinophaga sancti]WQG89469.1 galactosyltransferase-related protein [Chitinophaga sancti]SFW13406.1 Glycosyl transferase family 2 [Chitinophaga sancti]